MIERIRRAVVITIVRQQMVAGERVTGAPSAWKLAGKSEVRLCPAPVACSQESRRRGARVYPVPRPRGEGGAVGVALTLIYQHPTKNALVSQGNKHVSRSLGPRA